MEIQRELFHGETLELPSVPTERAEINGNRGNWPKLRPAVPFENDISKCTGSIDKEYSKRVAHKRRKYLAAGCR
jgi:hypothetical protein